MMRQWPLAELLACEHGWAGRQHCVRMRPGVRSVTKSQL